jgi:hypothetical protein
MKGKPYRRLALCAISLSLAVAAGCGGAAALTRADEISVASEPPGATVHAAGKRVGVTPLSVRQQDVFPVVFPPEAQDAYGTLVISKEGCRDHTVRVTNAVISKGVNVKLDCGQAELAKPKPAGSPGSPPPSIKERILRLNELREQGLITEEEYREIRGKILGEL